MRSLDDEGEDNREREETGGGGRRSGVLASGGGSAVMKGKREGVEWGWAGESLVCWRLVICRDPASIPRR